MIRLEPAEGKIGLSLTRVLEHKKKEEGEAAAQPAGAPAEGAAAPPPTA